MPFGVDYGSSEQKFAIAMSEALSGVSSGKGVLYSDTEYRFGRAIADQIGSSPTALTLKNSFDSARFGASKSGTAAANKVAIQKAIDQAAITGGVVWIGEAIACDGGLNLPSGVTLQGNNEAAFKGPSLGSDGKPTGACFLITDTVSPFITIQGSNVGIKGISFYYPNQRYASTTPANPSTGIIPYPSTITRKATGGLSSILLESLNFIGEYKGIDLYVTDPNSSTSDVFINRVYGFPLSGTGIILNKSYDCTRIYNCHFQPGNGVNLGVVQSYPDAYMSFSKEIVNYVNSLDTGVFYLDECDEFTILNSFVYGTVDFAWLLRSYGQIIGCSADTVRRGFFIHSEIISKAIIIDGFDCANSGGNDPSKRTTFQIEGIGNILINNVHTFVGNSPPVLNSASANANSFLLVAPGTDAGLDIQMSNCWASSGSSSYKLNKWIDAPTTTKIRQYGSRLYGVIGYTDGTIITKVAEPKTFPFLNNWQNLDATLYQPLTFQKLPTGKIQVRGLIANTMPEIASGTAICTVTGGCKPVTQTQFINCVVLVSITDVRSGVIAIDKTTGDVTPYFGNYTFAWINIDGEYDPS